MKDEKPQLPKEQHWLQPKYEGWRCVSRLREELARVGRKPYIVWIFGSAGGEGYCEADTKEEAFAAAYAFNWREEYAAQVYGPDGQSLQEEYTVYDRETFAKSDLAKWIEQRVAQRKAGQK